RHVGRCPERVASYGAMPGDIPMHSHGRGRDRQRGKPDIPGGAPADRCGTGKQCRGHALLYYALPGAQRDVAKLDHEVILLKSSIENWPAIVFVTEVSLAAHVRCSSYSPTGY